MSLREKTTGWLGGRLMQFGLVGVLGAGLVKLGLTRGAEKVSWIGFLDPDHAVLIWAFGMAAAFFLLSRLDHAQMAREAERHESLLTSGHAAKD